MQASHIASDYHPFRAGDLTTRDKRGYVFPICEDCGLSGRARRHRDPAVDAAADAKHRATKAMHRTPEPLAPPEPVVEYVGHAFVPGGAVVVNAAGNRNEGCAECGEMRRARRHWPRERSLEAARKQGATRRARGLGGSRAASPEKLPRPELVAAVDTGREIAREPQHGSPRVADWRLSMLRLALDMALEGPPLSFPLRRALLDARGALRSELHGIPATAAAIVEVPQVDELEPVWLPEPEPIAPRRAPSPAQSPRVQKVAASFRGSKYRDLYLRAIRAGWRWSTSGSGHVELVSPEGQRVYLSITAAEGRGHGFANARADAKRAGLDVTGL